MPSETDLCNDALAQIGQGRITAIDDGSIAANRCQDLLPAIRDALLRSHFWNFAIERAQLVQNATTPLFGFAYSYALPADFLRLKDYAGGNPTAVVPANYWFWTMPPSPYYRIEGQALLSNDATVYISYVRRVTNPALWDPAFYQVVAAQLAAKLAMALMHDMRQAQALLDWSERVLLPSAMAIDGQEGSIEPQIVDDLLWGR